LVTAAGADQNGHSGNGAGKLATGDDWTYSNTYSSPGNKSYPERNNSGFSAVPAGNFFSWFSGSGGNAHFWTSTQDEEIKYKATLRMLGCSYGGVYRYTEDKNVSFSVRCLRD